MKRIITVVIAGLILTACSKDIQQALEIAKAESDPAKSLEVIRQAEKSYLEQCNSLRCSVPRSLLAADQEYFLKAAKAGNERVLRELFTVRPDMIDLQNEMKGSVLIRAKDSKNADLLASAASIYGNDTLGVVNKAQQIEYLNRAWAAGDVKSAGQLAHIYVRLKDFDNAYFWSLRCTQECNRSVGVREGEYSTQTELLELEKHLDANKIATLQRESAARSGN